MLPMHEVSPPATAESVVVSTVRAATRDMCGVEIRRVEPGLKPYQPIQRKNVPSTCSAALCPGMLTGLLYASKRPRRGPTIAAPQSDMTPPVRWDNLVTPQPRIA